MKFKEIKRYISLCELDIINSNDVNDVIEDFLYFMKIQFSDLNVYEVDRDSFLYYGNYKNDIVMKYSEKHKMIWISLPKVSIIRDEYEIDEVEFSKFLQYHLKEIGENLHLVGEDISIIFSEKLIKVPFEWN